LRWPARLPRQTAGARPDGEQLTMRIALRRGAMLGLPTLGAALGALVAGTALSSQKPPAPANFTT